MEALNNDPWATSIGVYALGELIWAPAKWPMPERAGSHLSGAVLLRLMPRFLKLTRQNYLLCSNLHRNGMIFIYCFSRSTMTDDYKSADW